MSYHSSDIQSRKSSDGFWWMIQGAITDDSLGIICATEGKFHVNAYACQNCGHIELFEPSLDSYAKHLREEADKKRQKETLERQKKEEERKARIDELIKITKDENSTVKQVREANEELDRLHAKPGVIDSFSYR